MLVGILLLLLEVSVLAASCELQPWDPGGLNLVKRVETGLDQFQTSVLKVAEGCGRMEV